MSNVMEVSDGTFDAEVLKSSTPVLIDFYATWCGPCKMMAPVIDEVAKDYAGKLKVVKIDAEHGFIAIKGAVPGNNGSIVQIVSQ